MKMPYKKAIYRDVLERTRGLRIGFFLFSAVLTFYAYKNGCAESTRVSARVSVWPIVLLVITFAFFQEIRIHAFHRKKKWEWFQTVPFSKAEWYWTSRLAEITNLAVMILVMSLEECFACIMMVKKHGFPQTGMPFVRQAFYAFAAGLLFMGLLSVMRELTHSTASFIGLLLITLLTGYLSLEMLEVFTEEFTNGFGSLPVYWPTRFCLTERAFMKFDLETLDDIAIVYDTLAIVIAILVACGLTYLGSRFAKSSRSEFIGAESRNKKLFMVFVSTSLVLAFHIFTLVVTDSGFSGNVLLFLLLFALIIYLFCRLLKEKSLVRIGKCFLVAAVFFAMLLGVSGLTALAGRHLPKKENVIAVVQEDIFFTNPDAVSKAYDEIAAEKKRLADGGKEAEKTISYTVYTKYGSRSYEVPDTKENGLIIETVLEEGPNYRSAEIEYRYEPTEAILRYGNKPMMGGDIASQKEYKEILRRIPDVYKKEIPVYRVNAFGGLSLCKEKIVTIPDAIPEGGGYEVHMFLSNQFYDSNASYTFLFPDDPELVRYYIEEIQAPKWERISEIIKHAERCEISLSFAPKLQNGVDSIEVLHKRRLLDYIRQKENGAAGFGYVRGLTKRVLLPEELTDELAGMLNLSGKVAYESSEYVLAHFYLSCYTENPNGMLYELGTESILLALPKVPVEQIFDWVKEQIPIDYEEGGE
ncbi:MAG: hypothetical protein J5648_05555 [Lachnospiraceae bacterium]|nr:hypothetical protein [Lachnospiraceae bacterium]